MKQQEVFKKIGGIINEIQDQYEYLATTNGDFNDLELELLVANSHFLSDYIEVLRKIIAQNEAHKKTMPPVAAPAPAPQAPAAEPAKPAPAPIPVAKVEKPAPEPKVEPEPAPAPPPVKPATPEAPAKSSEPRYFEPVVEKVAVYSSVPLNEEPAEQEAPATTFEFDIAPKEQKFAKPEPEVKTPERETEDTETIESGFSDKKVEPEPEAAKPEPETIRHELTIDDLGDDWEDEEDNDNEPEVKPELKVAPKPEPTTVKPVVKAPEPEAAPKPEPIKPGPAKTPEPVVEDVPAVADLLNAKVAEAKTPAPQPPADKDEVLTFNQRISAQMGSTNRMSDQLHAQAISDLKSAISLNDKLLYVKDLFNGYSLAYSEAIEILNRFKSFEEAESFLKSYATKNNWKDKQATTDKFYALLHRKYGE